MFYFYECAIIKVTFNFHVINIFTFLLKIQFRCLHILELPYQIKKKEIELVRKKQIKRKKVGKCVWKKSEKQN